MLKLLLLIILEHVLTVMLPKVRSHGLDIDAYQRAELQLLLVYMYKRFGWAYICACVRSRRDWLRTKQYQCVHEFIFINNSALQILPRWKQKDTPCFNCWKM